jgi:hypothetical protein
LLKDGGATLTDDLIVDTDTLFVDASADRVIVGDTAGSYDLNVRRSFAGGDVGFIVENRDTTQTSATRALFAMRADVDNDGTLEEFLHIRGGTNTSSFAEFVAREGTSIRFQGDAGTSVVFNDSGVDQDFRVESSTNTAALFVDAENSRVGINSNAPAAPLHVAGVNGTSIRMITANADAGGNNFMDFYNSVGRMGYVGYASGSADILYVWNEQNSNIIAGTNSVEHMRFHPTNGTVFNEGGVDQDFRVESNNNTHMLFVDGGNDRIGINSPTPARTVDIQTTEVQRFAEDDVTGNVVIYNLSNNAADLATSSIQYQISDNNSSNNARGQVGVYQPTVSSHAGNFFVNLRKGNGDETNIVDFSSEGNFVLRDNATGNGTGPDFSLYRDSATPANNDLGPRILFDGENSAGAKHSYYNIYSQFTDVTDGGEDGTVHHQISSAGTLRSVLSLKGASEVSINEESQNIDFRVESNSNTHMLFVDAGNDRVGVGTNAPVGVGLTVNGGASVGSYFYGGTNNRRQLKFTSFDTASLDAGHEITASSVSGRLLLSASSTNHLQIDAVSNTTVFNEGGTDQDFRVESNGNSHAIFVNAGADGVGFGATASTVGSSTIEGMYYEIGGSLTVASNTETLQINRNNTGGNNRVNIGLYNNGTKRGEIGTYGAEDGMYFYAGSTIDSLRLTSGEAVFNEGGADINFRVESDSKTHAFFVEGEGSSNRLKIGMGTGTITNPYSQNNFTDLNLDGIWGGVISFKLGGTEYGWIGQRNSGNGDMIVGASSGQSLFLASNGNTSRIELTDAGNVVVNPTGADNDFRVESENRTDMFFVDAGNDRIGVKTSAPVKPLSLGSRSGANLSYIFGTSQTITEDNGIFVSGSTSDITDITYGLHLANNNNSNDAYSPVIGFSALSASDGFNHAYAYIAGYKTNNGADTNWNTGGIEFLTSSGTGPNTRLNINYLGGLITTPTTDGHAVFNESSADADFRVESDGNAHALFVDAGNNAVQFGTNSTNPTNGARFYGINDATNLEINHANGTASGTVFATFIYNQSQIGSITQNGTSQVQFNISSDARLKENITDADDAGTLIDAIQVRQFDWIADGEHQRYGMVAQELNTVAPEAVSQGNAEEDMMGVDYSKLVPMLIKEIQSLRARVADLES